MNPNLLKTFWTGIVILLLFPNVNGAMPGPGSLKAPANIASCNENHFSLNNPAFFISGSQIVKWVPLPLTLLEFTASVTANSQVSIDWVTAQEINVSYFEIERSPDGRKWSSIGRRTAKGTEGSITKYQFTDMNPYPTSNYYRLKVTDQNQRSDISPVRLVTFGDPLPVRLYPTLVRANSAIYIEGISPEQAQVEFFTSDGRIAYTSRLYTNTFNLPPLPGGIYHCRVKDISKNQTVCRQEFVVF